MLSGRAYAGTKNKITVDIFQTFSVLFCSVQSLSYRADINTGADLFSYI